ncbi:bifunctional 4-hydroxy-2-oxoglutarate aldolase/2-dehydro-3-deoxy-phosphogluconate aldolase [Sulfurimonas sp. HSL-1656]|uniref:bifunctional 4-hydroxy-2-oxoglutarate aldolase/2-dehydro-3-deoxy-phosphogluconate aldolase n=1 Tax=Thiomicrolovo subterrani TaxID=3131934 RepID=UPI0031F7B570
MTTLELFKISPVVPVVVLERVADAVPLAEALLEGGVGIMEVTLRSDAALECIEAISKVVPEMNVGAGTVINAGDLLRVRDAGGRFSFSPGISPELLSASAQEGITFIPGVATASELMAAINAGISGCKLFPATAVGGVELLRGFAGPFPEMRFCPTGGVSLANMNDFLSLPNVSCVGGSWIVPKTAVGAGEFEKITALCKEALGSVRS